MSSVSAAQISSFVRFCLQTKTMDKLGHNWIERSCSTESRCQDALEEETWEDQVYEVEVSGRAGRGGQGRASQGWEGQGAVWR